MVPLILEFSCCKGTLGVGQGLWQNFRDFEFRGDPNVYINREIQEVPVYAFVKFHMISYSKVRNSSTGGNIWQN